MQLLKHITIAASAIVAMMTATPVAAQFHLPVSHTDRHEELIANQRPAGVSLESLKIKKFGADHSNVADMVDEDLFNYNWSSQSITAAYTGLTIPQTRNIDVSGYVAPVRGRLTSGFGYRPRFGRMHKGVDLNLSIGDTVVAAFDGKVRITKYERRGYGYYVVLRHDNGLETVYGHLSRFLVKPDQYVRAGEPIALGGNTGRSTGPHLHFETRFMGLAINPSSIIDFENFVTHKDVFTFDKTECEKSQKFSSSKKNRKSKASKSKRRGKSTASAKRKKSGRR